MFLQKIQREISDAQACVEIEEKWYAGHTGALTVWKRPSTHTFEKLLQFVNKDSETKNPRHSKWPSCWSLSQVFLKVQIEWSGVETKQLSAWDLKYVTVPSLLLVLLIRWRKWTLKNVTILAEPPSIGHYMEYPGVHCQLGKWVEENKMKMAFILVHKFSE